MVDCKAAPARAAPAAAPVGAAVAVLVEAGGILDVPANGCIGGGTGPTRTHCSIQHSIQALVYALLKTLSYQLLHPSTTVNNTNVQHTAMHVMWQHKYRAAELCCK